MSSMLRNSQIARKYGVTPATVANWVEMAKSGRIGIELTKVGSRSFIEDIESNHQELLRLKEQGAKFRAKSTIVKVTPNPKIYDIFTEEQLISLFVEISYNYFIPMKYSYSSVGAKYYDQAYVEALNSPKGGSYREVELVNTNMNYFLNQYIGDSTACIVELGNSNSTYPAKNLLENLISRNKLDKYISTGYSEEMLKIRQRNLEEWFSFSPTNIFVDLETQSFRDLVFKEKEKWNTKCLYLLFDGFLGNVPNPLSLLGHLANSLSDSDAILIGAGLTNPESETDNLISRQSDVHDLRHTWLLDLLNLSGSLDKFFYQYDSQKKMRESYGVLKSDIEFSMTIGEVEYKSLLKRDEKLKFFTSRRFILQELISYLDMSGLVIEHYNLHRDGVYSLFLVRKKQSRIRY